MKEHLNNFIIRTFDIIFSFILIILISPFFIFVVSAIYFQDPNNPFYIAKRVGKNNNLFNMLKLRTMIINADKSGVDSTAEDDKRVTVIGKKIRQYKFDEIPTVLQSDKRVGNSKLKKFRTIAAYFRLYFHLSGVIFHTWLSFQSL